MTDLKSYFTDCPDTEKPDLMGLRDLRNWASDCRCTVCKDRKNSTDATTKQITSLFEEYNDIAIEDNETLTNHEYFLCPAYIKAFVFRTRKWGKGAFRTSALLI